jgi:hypothetical protein
VSDCCCTSLSTIRQWILNFDQWDRYNEESDATDRNPITRLLYNITITFTTWLRYSVLLIFLTIIVLLNEFSIETIELKRVFEKLIYFGSRVFTVSMFMKNSSITASWMVRLSVELGFSTIDTVVFWSSVSEIKSRAILIVFFVLLWYPPILSWLYSFVVYEYECVQKTNARMSSIARSD